ncbi:MAG: hypothetical protein V1793_03750 [Pseudomonadota bacterium]
MSQWYEPVNMSQWLQRTTSIATVGFCLAAAVLGVAEFRFDWCERMIGNYLTFLNYVRPETGAVWETKAQTSRAQAYLNTLAHDQETVLRVVEEAASFAELSRSMHPGQWTVIDRNRFRTLYLALPPSAAQALIPQAQLLWLLDGGQVARIFGEGTDYGMDIVFLDKNNRVLRQIQFHQDVLESIEKKEAPFQGAMEDIPGFAGRIYQADRFFRVLFSLEAEVVQDLISTPGKLLKETGEISRAGIWNEAESGYIRLGFEFDQNGAKKVVFVNGREWAVWNLSRALAEDGRP